MERMIHRSGTSLELVGLNLGTLVGRRSDNVSRYRECRSNLARGENKHPIHLKGVTVTYRAVLQVPHSVTHRESVRNSLWGCGSSWWVPVPGQPSRYLIDRGLRTLDITA